MNTSLTSQMDSNRENKEKMIDPIVNRRSGIKKNFSSKFEKTEDQPKAKRPIGQISSDLRRSNVSDLVTSLE
jgi:hypothetical protein